MHIRGNLENAGPPAALWPGSVTSSSVELLFGVPAEFSSEMMNEFAEVSSWLTPSVSHVELWAVPMVELPSMVQVESLAVPRVELPSVVQFELLDVPTVERLSMFQVELSNVPMVELPSGKC